MIVDGYKQNFEKIELFHKFFYKGLKHPLIIPNRKISKHLPFANDLKIIIFIQKKTISRRKFDCQ